MIPVNEPLLGEREKQYVIDCLDTTWISSAGHYLDEFEKRFSQYCGVAYGVSCSSGTAALHLAVAGLGLGPGDEVIMPAMTIVSCPLAVYYTGATPVLVDSEPDTGNIDVTQIEAKITENTKAIMPVHLYGHPVDMQPIMDLANKYNLKVIEDGAEAHGALYNGRVVGGIGDAGCFSFYANKIVTTGEGGMVVTNDAVMADKMARLRNLAHSPKRRFSHDMIGFNYRLTNVQAAIGLAQVERIEESIAKKRWLAGLYSSLLSDIECLVLPIEKSYAHNVYWMYNLLLKPGSPFIKDELMPQLKKLGVDTRSYFVPLHKQPVFEEIGLFTGENYPVAEDLGRRGFYVPSGLNMDEAKVQEVSRCLHQLLQP